MDRPVRPARLIYARATVNLSGFPVGAVRIVNAADPEIEDLLDHDFLAVVGPYDGVDPAGGPSYAVD